MNPKTPFRFTIDEAAKCILVVWAGDIDAQSMAESLRTILADPLFEPGMRFLHDCRRATFREVDLVTLGKFVPSARDYDSKRGVGRSAVVVGSSLEGRQLQPRVERVENHPMGDYVPTRRL